MNLETFYDYCINKKGVTEHFPFDTDTLVFKVGSKVFALTSLNKWESGQAAVNLKCDPDRSIELRDKYVGILPGFHMNKKHWNTVQILQDVSQKVVFELIDHSYDLVYTSLTKKEKLLVTTI